jgi:hypothetical protein
VGEIATSINASVRAMDGIRATFQFVSSRPPVGTDH